MGGELLFIPAAWDRISPTHRWFVPVVAISPYIFLYASVVTKPFITPENHRDEMKCYPYDGVIFCSGQRCRTCRFIKPARSKHCSFCKICISKADHHCIWLMNCVGRNNYRHFLSLLLSLSVLLVYGSYLGYTVLCQTWEQLVPPGSILRVTKQSWTTFLNIWFVVLAKDVRIGVVFLLVLMTAPLAIAFLVYHTYLVWAGMTTNESGKWSELKEDVADGLVFRSTKRDIHGEADLAEMSSRSWPRRSDQVFILTDGELPGEGYIPRYTLNRDSQKGKPSGQINPKWTRVRSMREVDNIYDLGFWNNLRDAVQLPIRR